MKAIKKQIELKGMQTIADVQKLAEQLASEFLDLNDGLYEITIQKPTRTNPQNNSIHSYCDRVATKLNDAGITRQEAMVAISKDIPWCMESVKEIIWRTIQKNLGRPDSTTKLKTHEVSEIYEYSNLLLTARLGMEYEPFAENS